MLRKLLLLCLILFLLPQNLFADVTTQDHNTDPALWDGATMGSLAFRGAFGPPSSMWVVTASEFTGNGGRVKKVSAIFRNSLAQNPNPNPWWDDFTYDIIFYPDSAAFVADPFGWSGNHGITRINLPAPTNLTHPYEVGYTLNFKLHRLEFDVSAFNIQTTNNATHLIAILPVSKIGSSTSGLTVINMSKGNGGSVGTGQGWYRSNIGNTGPATFSTLNFPHNQTSYKVVLEDTSMPHFTIDTNHIATTLSIQNANLLNLDFNNFSYKIGDLEVWPFVMQFWLTSNPLVFPMITGSDEVSFFIFLDLYGLPQTFGGCTTGLNPGCHTSP